MKAERIPSELRPAADGGLKRNALSARQVAIMAIAATGPASVVALNFGPMGAFAGAAMVLAFVLTMAAILLLVNSFIAFSRQYVSAGGLYAWNVKAFGNNVGFLFGWFFAGSYIVFAAAGFAVFGGWGEQYFKQLFNVSVPWWLFALAAIVYVAAFAYLGINRSVQSALVLLAFEMVVMLALGVWMLAKVGGHAFTIKPFLPSSSPGGWTGIGLAMTFGVLSMVGFEEATTVAEETQESRRAIGRGVLISAVLVPVFYIFMAYATLIGYGSFAKYGADPAPLLTLGSKFWGKTGLTIVVLAALSSILAFTQTAFNAGVRVMYALGRERVIPAAFGRTHPRHRTPHVAIGALAVLSVMLAFPLAFASGAFNVWFYFGFLISIMFLVAYALTNVALVVVARKDRAAFPRPSVLKHVAIPVAGAVAMLYPLYRTVHPLPPGAYRVMPLLMAGWIVLGLAVLGYLRRARPDAVTRVGSLMSGEDV